MYYRAPILRCAASGLYSCGSSHSVCSHPHTSRLVSTAVAANNFNNAVHNVGGLHNAIHNVRGLHSAIYNVRVLHSAIYNVRVLHTSPMQFGNTGKKHRWDKRLRIATGTILKRDTQRLPPSEALDVSVPGPDPSHGIGRDDGGVQYHGFVYYPRFPERDEPALTPAALHRVERIASLRGQPYWIKELAAELGLHEKQNQAVVLQNSATVNAQLYRLKHLVRIEPVTFPDGEPGPHNLDSWRMLEDGRVVRYAPPRAVPSEYDHQRIDKATLDKRLRLRWIRPFELDEKRTV